MDYKVEMKPLEWFSENPENYRAHPEEQLDVLQQSLERFGVFRNVVARPDGTILAGHGILRAAQRKGLTEFPTVVFEGSDAEARALMVADNEQSRLAQDDEAQLGALLSGLSDEGLLGLTGHDDDSLQALLAEVSPEPAEPLADPGAGELPAEAVTRPGDVWLLGKHRLVCGDSTDGGAWDSAMNGRKATMVWTDPPYGVNYGHNNNPKWGKHELIANDALDEQGMKQLWKDVGTLAAVNSTGDMYWAAPAGPLLRAMDVVLEETPWERHQWLVWVKNSLVLGRSNYHYRHEQIWYGWHENGKSSFCGGRNHDSVFVIDRPSRSDEHPTMKPVELVAEMVANSSKPGDIVADPFLGSGTTLIAAEQLKRVCYGIEIEPRYCDVAVQRWQRMTGRQAILESNNQPFPEQ
mgnify:CR=1 FL=1